MNILRYQSWSPYLVGAGIGVLSWFAFWSANHPLGITTAFENTSALVGRFVAPDFFGENEFYQEESPKIGWEWMLVLGVFIGSSISSRFSGDRNPPSVPPLWQKHFGNSIAKRFVAAFLGGVLMLFGARMAGGCTSGHGISGTLQLAVSSWLFVVIIFVVGIATAFFLYGRKGRNDV